jgi:MinD superfamily P-loop ATPase
MIIGIASGKGGTGKTTVATNLAAAIRDNVQLLDCDVEEPNAHLFLNPKMVEKKISFTPVPEVDKQKCSLCGKCGDICQFKAIVVVGETVLPFPELCHSCGGCKEVCPEDAITEIGRELGEIEIGHANGIEFIHGRLRVGEAMSPPLIHQVRSMADPAKLTIIDAPPGTSCPVIESIRNTDFVLLVTEPTPFGLNDLELAVGAVKTLGLPYGLAINRSDMGDKKVHEYAEKAHIPILMEIPFDRKIAELYSNGELMVQEIAEWRDKFLSLYERIKGFVSN